jgi:hypothetical protein
MGLVYRCGKNRISRKNSGQNDSSGTAHPALTTNLIRSVEAAKQAFDCFLQIPPTSYNHMPSAEWSRIMFMTIVLYRLSVSLPEVPDWNVELARQTVDFERCLSALIHHINISRIGTSSAMYSDPTLFAMFPDILNSVKTSYTAVREYPHQFPDGISAHKTLDKGTGFKPSSAGNIRNFGCPGFRNLPDRWNTVNTSLVDCSQSGHNAITELQAIENGVFWNHMLLADYPT